MENKQTIVNKYIKKEERKNKFESAEHRRLAERDIKSAHRKGMIWDQEDVLL